MFQGAGMGPSAAALLPLSADSERKAKEDVYVLLLYMRPNLWSKHESCSSRVFKSILLLAEEVNPI